MGLPGAVPTAAQAPTKAAPVRFKMPVSFTGSGSEYFRIWIVNLLLTIVTLGLYHPWAKVRRLRYFYGNTHIGDHTLDFHGNPTRMLRGFLLLGALLLLYTVAGKVSPTAGLIAFVIVAAVWPALFRAGQRFRLANTSWRGLRFRFIGSVGGAYRAMLPLFVPSGLFLAVTPYLMTEAGQPLPGKGGLFAFFPLVIMLLLPLFLWLLKKYQHDGYAFADNQTALRTGAGSFYLVFLKTLGVSVAIGICGGIVVAVLGGGAVWGLIGRNARNPSTVGAAIVAIALGAFLVYVAVIAVVQPYATSRLQNLVWNATRSTDIAFVSALKFRPLLWLTVKNWLLILITLGLYFPFATIAMARLRLQAVTVHTRFDPDEFASRASERVDDATGDAAGDLFGIDIGL
jgi:uncharacterized membrane protein YjgN (DUF898 family)